MFSWLQQQASNLVSTSAQTGQIADSPQSSSESASKKKKVDEEGSEIMEELEEGFVCVGRSSFYSHIEQPAVPFSYLPSSSNPPYYPSHYNNPSYQSPLSGMYPQLPSPAVHNFNYFNCHQTSDHSSLDPIHEALKYVPFVLRSDLRPNTTPVSYKSPYTQNDGKNLQMDWAQYEYDFTLERSVISEVCQFYANR
jgi:hypothetical protein